MGIPLTPQCHYEKIICCTKISQKTLDCLLSYQMKEICELCPTKKKIKKIEVKLISE